MKAIMIIASTLLLIYAGYRTYRYATMTKGLDQLIGRGAVILDVRTPQEYATGHIEGSVNISLGTIRERYTELDTAQTYITVCSHGLRSVKVQQLLEERGFKHLYNGGAWADLEQMIKAAFKK
ncbi:rhodanese-like domain-containing protein [Edaphocola flava]|uniref:rhodanese-like domain-containing protein n=1 Tax=Edaphocola flava TaxID=2499629 RepID=UPI00100C34A7|nr:rhodanese-like domain-containing protein [Edaphocola flava]